MYSDSVTVKSLQAFIRSNGIAWPGGYPCALLMGDCEVIDAQAARENYRRIRRNMAEATRTDHEWAPVEMFIYWESAPLICAHSGRTIESAYGIPE